MPNPNYTKGVVLERELVNAFRAAGYNACRSAGSHSKRDVFVWAEIGDAGPKKYPSDILYSLGFTSTNGLWNCQRNDKKYIDNLYGYSFSTHNPLERMLMFQCKRHKKEK